MVGRVSSAINLYLARSAVINVSIVFSSSGLFVNRGTPSEQAGISSLIESMILR